MDAEAIAPEIINERLAGRLLELEGLKINPTNRCS